VNAVTTAGSFNVDYVNGSWSESTLTYNLAPALGTTIVSSVPVTTAAKDDYILIDITPAVVAWLDGGQPNDGIALVASGKFNANFDSKENPGTSHPPELDIVFAGGGTITGVTTAAGSGLMGGGTSGTLNLSLATNCTSNQVLAWNGSAWACSNGGGGGTVSAVGLTAPSTDFIVTGSPVTTSGTLGLGWLVAPDFNDTPNAIVKRDSLGNFSAGAINANTSFNLSGNVFDQGSYASFNAFLGFGGNAAATGIANTASGYQALFSDTTGEGNTANGTYALFNNSTGNFNVAFGGGALYSNTTGTLNTATGGRALYNATATGNTANGHYALFATTTGGDNTAVGLQALQYNTTGSYNTALGFNAAADQAYTGLTNATAIGAYSDVTQSNSLVLGSIAGVNGATASTNVGIGTTSPQYMLDVHGTGNFTGLVTFAPGQTFPGIGTITGVTAGTDLIGGGTTGNVTLSLDTTKVITGVLPGTALTGGGTSGNVTLNLDTSQVPLLNFPNIFTGNQTVNGNLSATGLVTGVGFNIGSNLFAIGSFANSNAFLGFAGNTATLATSSQNTAAGWEALYANTTGSNDTAIGVNALASNTTGSGNTATGGSALYSNTTGQGNTATGALALLNNTGDYNTGVGSDALVQNTTGASNTGVGSSALQNNLTGQYNTAVGATALLSNTTGWANAALGVIALTINTTGNANTAVGYNTLTQNTSGSSNNAVGAASLSANTTGSSNIAFGNNALQSNITGNENAALGNGADVGSPNLNNATAIGAYAQVTQSNSLVLGGITGVNNCIAVFNCATVNVGIGTTAPTNVFTIGQGAGQALADGWSTYSSRRWKTNILTLHGALQKIEQLRGVSYDLKDSGKHEIGVIAEEVGAVVPEVVSWEKNGTDARSVDYGRLSALLIEATKEQQELILHQQEQIRLQQRQINAQQAQIARLGLQVKAIQAAVRTNAGAGSEVRRVRKQVPTVQQ